jgi:hypothetical protein
MHKIEVCIASGPDCLFIAELLMSVFCFFRFADDIEDMTGKRPWIGWMICWKYISPLALFIVVIATIYDLCKSSAAYDVFVGCEQVNYMKVLGEHSGLLSRKQMRDENL